MRQAVGLLRAASRSASAGEDAGRRQVRAVLSGIGLTRSRRPGRGQARERWESLAALAQLAEDFFAASPGASLADLAAELAARSAIGHAPALDGVTLASLHAAKGLEWDVVFLAGLTDGIAADRVRADRRGDRGGAAAAVRRGDQGPGPAVPVLGRWPGRPTGGRARKPSRFVEEIRPAAAVRAADRGYGGRGAERGDSMSKALDQVVDLLDLEQIEVDIFRGRSPEGERRQRVFGGQVAGPGAGRGRPHGARRPAGALAARLLHPAGRSRRAADLPGGAGP